MHGNLEAEADSDSGSSWTAISLKGDDGNWEKIGYQLTWTISMWFKTTVEIQHTLLLALNLQWD